MDPRWLRRAIFPYLTGGPVRESGPRGAERVRIVVVGGSGQLGRDLSRAAARRGLALEALSHADVEVSDDASVCAALDAREPAVVINTSAWQGAAAYNAADQEPFFRINALGAWNLARWCRRRGARLVHYSTDYVFGADTARRTPYTERDAPGATSVYGVSKLAGEQLVRATCPDHLVLRVASLYGRGGCRAKGNTNFVETILAKARAGETLAVVADQRMSPTCTADIAAKTLEMLERAAPAGLYHLAGSGSCSWHEFASAALDAAGVRAEVRATETPPDGPDVFFIRPRYTALDNAALRAAGFEDLPGWRDALVRYIADRGETQ